MHTKDDLKKVIINGYFHGAIADDRKDSKELFVAIELEDGTMIEINRENMKFAEVIKD